MSNPDLVTPSNPPPTEPPAQPGWQPTNSTIGSGIGGALAVIVVAMTQSLTKNTLDVVTVSAITTVCSTLAGYFFNGGRK